MIVIFFILKTLFIPSKKTQNGVFSLILGFLSIGMPHWRLEMTCLLLAMPHCRFRMPHFQLRTPHSKLEMPDSKPEMRRSLHGMPHSEPQMPQCQPKMRHSRPGTTHLYRPFSIHSAALRACRMGQVRRDYRIHKIYKLVFLMISVAVIRFDSLPLFPRLAAAGRRLAGRPSRTASRTCRCCTSGRWPGGPMSR
jgi:hypothetical protein